MLTPASPAPASIVTGATGGLGYETALGLARAGHRVVLTGRDAQKGAAALARVRQAVPGADAVFELLDVASLESVAEFAARAEAFGAVRLLVNNAGVMALPVRETTVDGFERQFGTNYLGHFALTGRLLPLLLRAGQARVVSLSSLAHRAGRLALDDLQGARHYDPWGAYRQSKLAMLLFARELQRRAELHGWALSSLAAHPGWSATSIVLNGVGQGLKARFMQAAFNFVAQSAEAGARPVLHAALAADARPGAYYGPSGPGEIRGAPSLSKIMPQALDQNAAERLWVESETLTGVRYGG